MTLGAATAFTPAADAMAGTAVDTPAAIKTTLAATGAVGQATGTGVLVVGGTIDLPGTTATTWNFTGTGPVVFRNVTIRCGGAAGAQPASLTINAEATIQFINCTIDLTDRRAIPANASGTLLINGCSANVGTVDVQNSTFRTNGVRGLAAATAAGAITVRTDITVAGPGVSPVQISGSTLNASGGGMVQATVGLPIVITATDTTIGQSVTIATRAGPIRIDGSTTIITKGGDAIALSTDGAQGAKAAGEVIITAGIDAANQNDLIFNGRIDARGGDALNAPAGRGGDVTITARRVNIGNAAGRPVLLSNGGSNSIVGSLSMVGAAGTIQGPTGTGGPAGFIHFTNGARVQEGPFSMAAGSALVAIGGGGDSGGGNGGAISFGVDQFNEATAAEATAQTVTMAGVVDSSGGWVRAARADGAFHGTENRGGNAGAIAADGNTGVTLSGVILANGGSPARSANSASPVGGANRGGDASTVTIRAGMQNGGSAAEDVGHLVLSGFVGARGGFYTFGAVGALGAADNAGGNGNTVTLAGERLTVETTGRVITDGGSCGDVGQFRGGRAGAIVLDSGIANTTLGANAFQTGPLAENTTHLLMQGLLQADGGNVSKGGDVSSGSFVVSRTGTAGTTVTVHWPAHGATVGDLVTVSGASAAAANAADRRVTSVTTDTFTYEATGNVVPGTYQATVTLTKLGSEAQGGSNLITVRQDNVQKVQLTGTNPRDRVEVSGSIFARAGKVRAAVVPQPGRILITGSRVPAGTAAQTDGGNVVIAQQAVVTAAGFGAAAPNDINLTLRTEDAGVITVRGKLTVDNDRPAGFGSGVGNMLLHVLQEPQAAGSIVLETTAELLVSGGHAGTAANSGLIDIFNEGTGPLTLTPAFVRSEDQTVDPTQDVGGKGGRIRIRGNGVVNHSAGQITARGTGSALGHGGQIEIAATGGTTTSVVNLTGAAVARVDGDGPNGWGGRIQVRAAVANGGAGVPAILVDNSYTLSADGSGRGAGGLPVGQSLRSGDGFGGAAEGNGNGGIYIGGVNAANVAVNEQIVTIRTTTALSARGGDNGSGTLNANGTPASGCFGGVVVIGDGNPLGILVINSGINVSGGANNAGPGGSGGQIAVRCNGAAASTFAVASTAATTWSAAGGNSTFPQSVGGTAGNILVTGTANSTIAFGAAGVQFRANLAGGAGPTVGGDAGVFEVTNNATTSATGITFAGPSTVTVTGGSGSITGKNGVVRLNATQAGTNIPLTNGVPTNLVVEPANGATGNPVQTLFVNDN
ncbi:MAG: hypothetical protein M9894_32165 [Planctomycetes bacterium]|nr:hypothetical protein [Planctomycetota bacterium]